jgi:signal transduction histidine kinase
MFNLIVSFIVGVMLTALTGWQLARRQKEKQRRLLRRTRRAEKLAELGTLTGHLAHEIRNPLSIIKINLQLLSEDIAGLAKNSDSVISADKIDSSLQRYHRQLRKIEAVTRETDRLTNTLNNFLRYAGRMEMHPGRYDVNEILDDLIDFYEPQALSKQVQVRRGLSELPAVCRVDKDLLKQAFLNLFINAVQVMGQGGELMIRSKLKSQLVLIEVIDTGPGIPPEEQEKVFDPYYTTRSDGTGLGLPTCRRIIEEHHGHIELHSEPGKGTCFTIELPLADKN